MAAENHSNWAGKPSASLRLREQEASRSRQAIGALPRAGNRRMIPVQGVAIWEVSDIGRVNMNAQYITQLSKTLFVIGVSATLTVFGSAEARAKKSVR